MKPLVHIAGVRADPETARGWYHGKLTLHVRGSDTLWALKSSLEIPIV